MRTIILLLLLHFSVAVAAQSHPDELKKATNTFDEIINYLQKVPTPYVPVRLAHETENFVSCATKAKVTINMLRSLRSDIKIKQYNFIITLWR